MRKEYDYMKDIINELERNMTEEQRILRDIETEETRDYYRQMKRNYYNRKRLEEDWD